MGVLFVCLGNICRSPTSEGVFRHCLEQAKLDVSVQIDSAGTANYHVGQPSDARAIEAAARRGVDLKSLRGRQICSADFTRFDYIIAMDRFNYDDLMVLSPAEHSGRIKLFMEFAKNCPDCEISDPYYGGASGFEKVLDMIVDASLGLLDDIRNKYSIH